jgi:membrane-associated protease RseP (regulator of RpoE activity)
LRWNGQAVQVRPAKPEVVLTPTEPRLELKVEPRLELRLAPVVESHDPVQELRAPARQGRSWIGVELTSDDQGEAELEVGRVIEGSPAERAELEEGDRLVALDGEPLSSFQDLRERLDQRHPGQRVKLTVQRTLSVELDQRGYGEQGKPRLGVRLAEDDHGLATDSVESGWPAEAAGLRAGDIIKSIEGREVHTTSDLTGVLGEIEPGDSVEIGIERSVKLELGTFPGEEGQAPGGGAFSFGSRKIEVRAGWTRLRRNRRTSSACHAAVASSGSSPLRAARSRAQSPRALDSKPSCARCATSCVRCARSCAHCAASSTSCAARTPSAAAGRQ